MEQLDICDSIWDSLSAYADGEATPEQASRVEGHVAACRQCASDLRFMRGTAVLLADAPLVEPPAGLREAILAATIERRGWLTRVREAAAGAFAPSRLPALGMAAAVLLVGLIGVSRMLQPVEPRPVARALPAARTVARAPEANVTPSKAGLPAASSASSAKPTHRAPVALASAGATARPTHHHVYLETSSPRPHVTLGPGRTHGLSPRPGSRPTFHPELVAPPADEAPGTDIGAGTEVANAGSTGQPTVPRVTTPTASAPSETRLAYIAEATADPTAATETLADVRSNVHRRSALASRTDNRFDTVNGRHEVELSVVKGRF